MINSRKTPPEHSSPYVQPSPDALRAALERPARLSVLRATMLLDTPPDEELDRLTRLAARAARTPMALISLIEDSRQFLKSAFGLIEPWASRREFPLNHSFCQYAIAAGNSFAVSDAREHPRLREAPAISQLRMVAYLGVPLLLDGQAVGALCVTDQSPREWSAEDTDALRDLAAAVITEIELRRERALRERAEEACRESESLLHGVIESTTLAVSVKDLDGRYRMISKSGAAMLGWTAADVIGRFDSELLAPETAQRLEDRDRSVIASGEPAMTEEPSASAGEAVFATTSVYRGVSGEAAGLISISRAITERQREEAALRLLHSVVAAISEADDLNGALLLAVQKLCEVTGWEYGEVWMPRADGARIERTPIRYRADRAIDDRADGGAITSLAPREGLPGRAWSLKQAAWVPDVTVDEEFSRVPHAKAMGLKAGVAIPVLAADEAVAVIAFYMDGVREEDERLVNVVSVVSAQLGSLIRRKRMEEALRKSEEELRKMSLTDDLTGLNNRRGFFMLAEQEMKVARRLKKDLLLLYIDLDGLKLINDTFGHQEGDGALSETAEILRTTFRESDIMARLGGDEFVTLAMLGQNETLESVETRLQQCLAAHNANSSRRYDLAFSCGMARFSATTVLSLAELMSAADEALYDQKRKKSRE